MQAPTRTTLYLNITVAQNVTVLPRILQVISRRGLILTSLVTTPQQDGSSVLACTVQTPERWQGTIAPLLERLHDVILVEVVKGDTS